MTLEVRWGYYFCVTERREVTNRWSFIVRKCYAPQKWRPARRTRVRWLGHVLIVRSDTGIGPIHSVIWLLHTGTRRISWILHRGRPYIVHSFEISCISIIKSVN
jgi:hypothetical protein